jgi:hypothetical protein
MRVLPLSYNEVEHSSSTNEVTFISRSLVLPSFIVQEVVLIFCVIMQLRNLVWATSNHDVYLVQNYSIMHWSPLKQKGVEVLNVAGHIVPSEVISAYAFYCLVLVTAF